MSSILSSDSEVNLNQGTPPPKLLQVIQHLTLNPDQGKLLNTSHCDFLPNLFSTAIQNTVLRVQV